MSMPLVNVLHPDCHNADASYYIAQATSKIPYGVAVKRCLQTVTRDENEAIHLLNSYHSYVIEGMHGGHLPSDCASAIVKVHTARTGRQYTPIQWTDHARSAWD